MMIAWSLEMETKWRIWIEILVLPLTNSETWGKYLLSLGLNVFICIMGIMVGLFISKVVVTLDNLFNLSESSELIIWGGMWFQVKMFIGDIYHLLRHFPSAHFIEGMHSANAHLQKGK